MKKSILTILVLVGTLNAACTSNGNGTVSCSDSKLMWQDDDHVIGDANAIIWQDAISYCEGLTLAGHDDWRLPNRNEIKSIVDYEKSSGTKIKNGFTNTSSRGYWSSTTTASDTSFVWVVYFHGIGDRFSYKQGNHESVRCVRAGQ